MDYNDFGYWNSWDYGTAEQQIVDDFNKKTLTVNKFRMKLDADRLGIKRMRTLRKKFIQRTGDLEIDYLVAEQEALDRLSIYEGAEENKKARYHQYLNASLEKRKISGKQVMNIYLINLLENGIEELGGNIKNPYVIPERYLNPDKE